MLRRWVARMHLVTTLLLVGVVFILVNYVFSRRYARVDTTRAKISTLSSKTTQALAQLTEPVSIVVFYQPQAPTGQPDPLYPLITDLLKEYQGHSAKLTVESVDPYRDRAKAEQLSKQFDIDRINLVIVHAGTRHKYLSDTDLAEFDYDAMGMGQPPRIRSFKGEEAITSAILSVTQSTQPLVWVTTGHGEKAIDDPQLYGLTELKMHLERENMRVEAVTLPQHTEIPAEVSAVFIPGPTHRLTDQELLLLQGYLERGGRLLALIDPLQDTGLDDLLSRWGAELGQDIVVDPARQLPVLSAANLFVTTYTQHPIVEHMDVEKLMTLFPLTRSVRPSAKSPEIKTTELALTSPDGWGERQAEAKVFEFNADSDTHGPVSIAVAAERTAPPATRVVVIGDSDFVINTQLTNVGNLDFILGAFYWLVGQEQLIGIGPKTLDTIRLSLTASQLRGMQWLSLVILPGMMAGMGLGLWWVRRT